MSAAPSDKTVTVVQVRSTIGSKPVHRATIKALGLGRIGARSELADSPDVRGMLMQVRHLITISEANGDNP